MFDFLRFGKAEKKTSYGKNGKGKIGRTGSSVSGQVTEEEIKKAERSQRKAEQERIKAARKDESGFVKEPIAPAEELDQNRGKGKKASDAAGEKKKKIKNRGIRENSEPSGEIFRERGGIDRPMLIIILILISFGSVMVFSASYAYAHDKTGDSYFYIKRQIVFSIMGIAAMFGVSFLDYRIIRKITPVYFGVSALFLVAVLLMGVAQGAAVRWLDLGPFSFQPSEVMKLGLVLMLAWYYSIAEKEINAGFWRSSLFGTFIPMGIVVFVCVLVALEKHISGTIIMFSIGMIVIFVAGGKLVWFLAAGGGFAAVIATVIMFTDYATKRLDIFLHPENYSVRSEVWQTLQGTYAIGSGGFFGVGLGNSRQKHLFVSQPQNDFIYSIICEELGFVGAVGVILLFVAFVWRGFIIAKRTPDTFSRLAVIGIVSKVAIQALLNIAVVTDTIPNTGISLPFFSYGGTALLILFLEMGVLLSISRYSYLQKK